MIAPLTGTTLILNLRDGIRIEDVGDDVIVLDRTGSAIHRATGDAADVLRLATTGDEAADVPAHVAAAVASLTDAGLLAPSGISRRTMLLAAGAVGGGLASFALATPAHALSVCPVGTPATHPGPYDMSGTFTTGPGVTSVTVQAWGGGGGGSDDAGMMGNAGGGGGGGAFRAASVEVTECTSYGIVVGGGGSGGTGGMMGDDGGPGGSSSFGGTLFVVNGGAGASGSSGGAGGAGPTFAGGAGATAAGDNGGGGGGSAGAGGPGGDGAGQAGGAAGAGSPGGAPGGAGANDMANGSPGSTPGGGGGGAGDMGMSGGNGAPGRVIVIVP